MARARQPRDHSPDLRHIPGERQNTAAVKRLDAQRSPQTKYADNAFGPNFETIDRNECPALN